MNCTSTISVFNLIGSSVHTRESSEILMHQIETDPCNFIEIDFSQVDYISRSFADQFYFDKMKCAIDLKKDVIVGNANESVVHMLNAVSRTQNKKRGYLLNIPVYKYSSQSELENFLLSI